MCIFLSFALCLLCGLVQRQILGGFFQNSQKISCPLTDTIKMKCSTPSSQVVVLGIASVPCCESEGSAFLRILEWTIISHYILRVKNPHQQEVTLNRVHTHPPHTIQLDEHLGMTSCRRECLRIQLNN